MIHPYTPNANVYCVNNKTVTWKSLHIDPQCNIIPCDGFSHIYLNYKQVMSINDFLISPQFFIISSVSLSNLWKTQSYNTKLFVLIRSCTKRRRGPSSLVSNVCKWSAKPNWYADTGATAHMRIDPSNLVSCTSYKGNEKNYISVGAALGISHTGKTVLSSPPSNIHLQSVSIVLK